jgi:hypothetical protein
VASTQARSLSSPVSRLCLTLEAFRRIPEGRIRGAEDFQTSFFPHDATASEDKIFCHIPPEVRACVLTAWGLRGAKTALRDTNEKVRAVVHDALLSGDLDAQEFEEGLDASLVIRCVPLAAWWRFWRAGEQTKATLGKVLVTAYSLELFDAEWFFGTVVRGALEGTDAVAEGLSKADLSLWMKRVHESGDGSPRGLLSAIGWDGIIANTPSEVLGSVVDALAKKVGLIDEELAPAARGAEARAALGGERAALLEDDEDAPTNPALDLTRPPWTRRELTVDP